MRSCSSGSRRGLTIAVVAPNSVQMLKMFGLKDKRYKTRSVYSSLKECKTEG